MLTANLNFTYALPSSEKVEFYYNNKVFNYTLENNLKFNDQFDLNYKINKHNRFGTTKDRQQLLKNMLMLGFDEDIIVNYLFPNMNSKIAQIEKVINTAPKNAELKVLPNTEKVFFITKEKLGKTVLKSDLYSSIINKYLNNEPLNINIPTEPLYPTITSIDFEKFSHKRADFSTNISSSTNERKHNIKNAMHSLNKVEILPNQIFSFNKTVGKRTAENGYREAKIIVNDEFVDGLGGGVCQVSSTLYNAALLAGLEIVEANKHSKQVGYVKYGFDAMVNFGSSDLKFKNNTNEKLIIITNFSLNNIRIRIFGEKMAEIYKLSNEIINVTEPIEEIKVDSDGAYLDKVQFDDEYFYLKKASKGMEIKSYREKYKDNQLVDRVLLRHDKFKVQNAIKVFGNKKRATTALIPICS